jgi:lysozyme
MNVQISEQGVALIKRKEDFRSKVYFDDAGKPTIGYGTRITEDNIHLMDATVDKAFAEKLLLEHIAGDTRYINKVLKVELNQNQSDAIHSFVYNMGRGAFGGSTLLRKINNRDSLESILKEFPRWKHVTVDDKKIVVPGLLARRKDEAALFASRMMPSKKKAISISTAAVVLILIAIVWKLSRK